MKYILESCEKKSENGRVTRELFMLELLNYLNPTLKLETVVDFPIGVNEEMANLRAFFAEKVIDINKTYEKLSQAISGKCWSFLDYFLFDKVIKEIEFTQKERGLDMLNAMLICEQIFKNPPTCFVDSIVYTDAKPAEVAEGDSNAVADETDIFDDEYDGFELDEEDEDDEEDDEEDDDAFCARILEQLSKGIADEDEEEEQKKDKTVDKKMSLFELVESAEKIRKQLSEKVFGQDPAITTFVSAYFQSELVALTQAKRNKPRAVFVFVGPPGVGKTFLAEQVAECLGLPYKRFDMSEYSDKEGPIEFCGSDKVYRDGKVGNVTSFVARNPHSVLLFDEVEKAHPNVINLYLQMLDAGRLRDNYSDEEVSFVDTIIIFTTNAGKNLYEDDSVNLVTIAKNTIVKALRTDKNPTTGNPYFPAAICSRFASGNIVMFNHMDAHNLLTISANEIDRQVKCITCGSPLKIEVDERVFYALLYSEGANADARTIKSRSVNFLHQEIYELMRLLNSNKEKYHTENLKTIKFEVQLPKDKDILKFFTSGSKHTVLAFGSKQFTSKCKELITKSNVICTSDIDKVPEIIKCNDIECILCDLKYKISSTAKVLNIDDISSVGRDFFKLAVERYSQPIYLYCGEKGSVSEEETASLLQSGARGVIYLDNDMDDFLYAESDRLYQQACLSELAMANKVLSFRTLQTVSDNGDTATITLFGFERKISIDAGDSRGMVDSISKPNISFKDVIGATDAKDELAFFIEYLKSPEEFAKHGVKAPKGVLLYGPPGTGKTMLAKATAGESDVTFITAEGNQFLKSLVGAGSESVHQLFRTARKYAPSILFIDEIDAIGKNRQTSSNGDNVGDILTAFLTEMDGFKKDDSKPVFVLAATNYGVAKNDPRGLDPALLRRFDRKIYIDLPNKDERIEYIKLKMAKIPKHSLSSEQIENIAMRSTGASLAELESIFELALRNLIKSKTGVLTDEMLDEAFETYNGGEIKRWSQEELLRTARHEAGHALVCRYGGEKPSYLTIVSRGDHGGYMQHEVKEDKGVYTKNDLLKRVRTALAGRACEVVYYGKEEGTSTGASGDLRQATDIVESMICNYGMDEDFGLISINENVSSSAYYEKIASRAKLILAREFEITKAIIEQNKKSIDKLVNALFEKNSLKSNEIEELLGEIVILK